MFAPLWSTTTTTTTTTTMSNWLGDKPAVAPWQWTPAVKDVAADGSGDACFQAPAAVDDARRATQREQQLASSLKKTYGGHFLEDSRLLALQQTLSESKQADRMQRLLSDSTLRARVLQQRLQQQQQQTSVPERPWMAQPAASAATDSRSKHRSELRDRDGDDDDGSSQGMACGALQNGRRCLALLRPEQLQWADGMPRPTCPRASADNT